jgi:archaellum component FlaF (FlaF/FlaG flagellin family)
MKGSKIVSFEGSALDLSRINAIKVNTNSSLGPTNILTVDLKSSFEYVFNPNKNKYKKVKTKDHVEIEYVDYNAARESMEDLTGQWREYLESPES